MGRGRGREQIYWKFWPKRGHCHSTVHPMRGRAEPQWLSHEGRGGGPLWHRAAFASRWGEAAPVLGQHHPRAAADGACMEPAKCETLASMWCPQGHAGCPQLHPFWSVRKVRQRWGHPCESQCCGVGQSEDRGPSRRNNHHSAPVVLWGWGSVFGDGPSAS